MTRRSKREIERAVEKMGPRDTYTGPSEIIIRREVVGTDWDGSDLEPGGRRSSSKRIYREGGEWCVEELPEER